MSTPATSSHLAASGITARVPVDRLDAVVEGMRSAGLSPPQAADGNLRLSVPRQQVPAVLSLLAGADARDITCTPASLEDLFLRHYEVVAR